MNKNPLISILIITYNRLEDTLALLKNISIQDNISSLVGEILILNNASDESYSEVENFIAENKDIPFLLINSDENLGVARGRNFLIKRAQYPYLLALDDDVVFDSRDAVATAATLFDIPLFRENKTAVITLNIHYFDTGERQKNALPHKKYEEYKDRARFLTSYFIGAAHLMKKELFDKTGYYPEDFFYGMEEYDLSYRIIDAGYTLGYDSQIKILHKESPEGRVPSREKLRMMWYNKSVVAWKYLPTKYFYSTLLAWGAFYFTQSKLDVKGLLAGFKKAWKIPKKTTKSRVSGKTLKYLHETEGRLWY